jgi:hypothetical protein
LLPQGDFKQASTHLLFWQDFVGLQSESTVHSGRQLGGEPMYPISQVQIGNPLLFLQRAKFPQGEGWQGSEGSSRCGLIRVQNENGDPS